MATLDQMAEVCTNCNAPLDIGQIGLCDDCQVQADALHEEAE
ncbi:hypothetical protein [Comamonas thiooxydans]|nr:hypothetical protein [Comamonas thiooxydans]